MLVRKDYVVLFWYMNRNNIIVKKWIFFVSEDEWPQISDYIL